MLVKKIITSIKWSLTIVLALISSSVFADYGHEKDKHMFVKGSHIEVHLNWRSFKDVRCPIRNGKTVKCPFPKSFSQQSLERAVRKVIDNWVQLSGMNLKVTLVDTDSNKSIAGANEILIRARSAIGRPESLAIAATLQLPFVERNRRLGNIMPGRATIYFYRQHNNGQNISWSVFQDEKFSLNVFMGTLTHEMGHALGVMHNNGGKFETAMNTHSKKHRLMESFGPYKHDISDVVDIYGKRKLPQIKVRRSTDKGLSWSNRSSNIPSNLTSTMPLTVNRDDDRMILFLTEKNKKPGWAIGDQSANNFGKLIVFGGERSFYGVAGHGYDDEYLMAWVDHTEDHRIRVVRLTNKTKKRIFADPPASSATIGTPAVHKLAKNTWILTYATLDKHTPTKTGRIVSRISTNDGRSWGKEIELYKEENWRAIRGVSVTSDGPDEIAISFAHATNALAASERSRAGAIVTITAHLDRNNKLRADQWRYNAGVPTINEPSITRTGSKFILGYHGQNGKLISRNALKMPGWWNNKRVVLPDYQFVGPAVTARRNSSYVFMFYLH